MKFFYCQSYQAFNLALAMNIDEEVTVITATKNIIKACEFLKVNYIEHKQFSTGLFIRNKNDVDKEVNRLIETFGDNELHFSHTQFAVFCFYLVKRLNDYNKKTIFHDFEYIYTTSGISSVFNKNYILTKLMQINIKYKYLLPIEVRMSTSNSFMLSLNIAYIHNTCSEVVSDKENYHDITLKMFKEYKFNYPVIENLFIAQTFTNESLFRKDKIGKLLPVINDNRISIKNHPKLGSVEGLYKCKVLPDFLPVELFFQKVKGSIISFHSTSLITASKFDNIRTISLLDIVKSEDPFIDNVKKDIIDKTKGKVLFPQAIDDFNKILYA